MLPWKPCNNPTDTEVTACSAFNDIHYSRQNYAGMSSNIGPFRNGQYALFANPNAPNDPQYRNLDFVNGFQKKKKKTDDNHPNPNVQRTDPLAIAGQSRQAVQKVVDQKVVEEEKKVADQKAKPVQERYGCGSGGSCGGGLQTIDKNQYYPGDPPQLLPNYYPCNCNSKCNSGYCRQYYSPSINPRNQPNFGICADFSENFTYDQNIYALEEQCLAELYNAVPLPAPPLPIPPSCAALKSMKSGNHK